MYIKRHVEKVILEAAQSFPCVVVYGPRQVGKSTTVNMLFGDKMPIVTLDDAQDRELATVNPRLFLERYGWPLIIDEIQKAPNLLDEIKINIDKQRLFWLKNNESRKLMYILTGSNRFELQQGISDSLAGRCGVVEMLSLSQAEKANYARHAFAPEIEALLTLERDKNVWGVLLATLVGVPIYADIFGTLPIAEALYLASVPVGTILALMMSITTLSLPSLIMLSKVMTPRLLGTFIGIVVGGIVFIGYFFNMIW